MERRVVVTGMGAITPIGNNVEEFFAGIKEGKVGIGPITKFDATEYKANLAAEVKDFSLDTYGVDRKLARKMSRFAKFLLGASIEAVTDAGYTQENFCNERFTSNS